MLPPQTFENSGKALREFLALRAIARNVNRVLGLLVFESGTEITGF